MNKWTITWTSLLLVLAGKTMAATLPNCVVCHGTGLAGNQVLQAPNLTMLPKWYVLKQLQGFDLHWRGTTAAAEDMRAVVVAMTKKDIKTSLDYVARLPTRLAKPRISGDLAHGKSLYQDSCATCHGPAGNGDNNGPAPALAGQNDWYLLSQLKAFMAGTRGANPRDRAGQDMRSNVAKLSSEQDAVDVVSYINSLTRSQRNKEK